MLLKLICLKVLFGAAALSAGVPWCPSCRQITGPEFLCQLDTIFPPTLLLWISTRILYNMVCWASVSRCSLGKCQTLTYIESLVNVGLLNQSSLQYGANSCQIVCAVLALDSWNYCSGKQAQHLPQNVCQTWVHWLRGSRIPGATLWQGSLT